MCVCVCFLHVVLRACGWVVSVCRWWRVGGEGDGCKGLVCHGIDLVDVYNGGGIKGTNGLNELDFFGPIP